MTGKWAPLEDRFWAKVDKTGECWSWTSAVDRFGYGRISVSAAVGQIKAHRYSYMLHFGAFHRRDCVLHRCDNPLCVRPTHLFLGDRADNNADMAAKGRHWKQRNTHCPHGHVFSPANTYSPPSRPNKRECRKCRSRRDRERAPARHVVQEHTEEGE